MGPSYYRQGAAGLGWPDGSLAPGAKGVALAGAPARAGAGAGVGGLGWPDTGQGARREQSRGSRGVQVSGEESGVETAESAMGGGRPEVPAPPPMALSTVSIPDPSPLT